MKMNKLVKGLLVGFIALQMVGCEEAKEVENLNIQDTNPLIEQAKDLQEELEANDEYNEAIKNYIASDGQDQEALRGAVGVALDKANETKVEEKVEAPVVKEEPKEVAHDEDIEPCVICGEFGFKKDMIRMGDGYYDEFCYNEVTKVEEEVEAPTAMTAEEFDNAKCENCGHDVSDVIDNAGGYWCEACDYVK